MIKKPITVNSNEIIDSNTPTEIANIKNPLPTENSIGAPLKVLFNSITEITIPAPRDSNVIPLANGFERRSNMTTPAIAKINNTDKGNII